MQIKNLTFSDILDDLTVRFIINIPAEELESIERVLFQVELSHWFYEDFIVEKGKSLKLRSFNLKQFSYLIFKNCPLLNHWVDEHEEAFTNFMKYKVKVPTCGAIILNLDMTKVLLVRGWKANSSWGFPKGKINQEEAQTSCAIREVFEETGFDVSNYIRENEYLERKIYNQIARLYMISGIDESVEFITQTRKEIGDIKWHPLSSIPGFNSKIPPSASDDEYFYTRNKKYKYYMVTPFLQAVRKWINRFRNAKKKGKDRSRASLILTEADEENTSENEVGDTQAPNHHYDSGFGLSTIEQGMNGLSFPGNFPFGFNHGNFVGPHTYQHQYASPLVPQNERVVLEDSLKSLLGMGLNTDHQQHHNHLLQQQHPQHIHQQHLHQQQQYQQHNQEDPQMQRVDHGRVLYGGTDTAQSYQSTTETGLFPRPTESDQDYQGVCDVQMNAESALLELLVGSEAEGENLPIRGKQADSVLRRKEKVIRVDDSKNASRKKEKKSTLKKEVEDEGPKFGQVKILKREKAPAEEVKKPPAILTRQGSTSVLLDILKGRKRSAKESDELLDLLCHGSAGPSSAVTGFGVTSAGDDPGLELALSAKSGHHGFNTITRSPSVTPLTREKQSLMDILNGTSGTVNPSPKSPAEISSNRNNSAVGLVDLGPTSSVSASQQSLLDILQDIPKPPNVVLSSSLSNPAKEIREGTSKNSLMDILLGSISTGNTTS